MPGIDWYATCDNSDFIRSMNEMSAHVRQIKDNIERAGIDIDAAFNRINAGKNLSLGTEDLNSQVDLAIKAFDRVAKAMGVSSEAAESAKKKFSETILEIANSSDEATEKQQQLTKAVMAFVEDISNGSIGEFLNDYDKEAKKFTGNIEDYYKSLLSALMDLRDILQVAREELPTLSDDNSKAALEEIDNSLDSLNVSLEDEINTVGRLAEKAHESTEAFEEQAETLGKTARAMEAVDELGKEFTIFSIAPEEELKAAKEMMEKLVSLRENIDTAVGDLDGEAAGPLFARLDKVLEKLREVESVSDLFNEKGLFRTDLMKDINSLEEIERGLLNIKEKMQQTEDEANKAEKAFVGIRTQILQARKEIEGLLDSGQEGTQEFYDAVMHASELSQEMKKINLLMDYNSKGGTLRALRDGLQGVAGAASLATGVMGLFNRDSEKMEEIQTRIQSLLGIIVGLQETYAFVTKGATIAQTLFNKAANANPYVLLATVIGTVVAGLGAYIASTREATKEENVHVDNIKNHHKEWAVSVANTAAEQISSYKKLQDEYNSLGDSLGEKEKFILDNKDAFISLGFSVNNVSDAENIFVKNTDAVVSSIMARAKAAAYQELATEEIKKQILRDQSNSSVQGGQFRTVFSAGQRLTRSQYEEYFSRYGKRLSLSDSKGVFGSTDMILTEEGARKMNQWSTNYAKMRRQKTKEEKAASEEYVRTLIENGRKETQAEINLLKGAGIEAYTKEPKSTKTTTKTTKADDTLEKEQAAQHAKQIEEELRYQDELRKIRQEASDARRDAEIASIQNDAERERAEQDEQHERNLRQIEEHANEMRKAIYEHNKKAWENAHKDSPYENTEAGKAGWMGLQLSEDQQATIDALMQKENAEYLRLVEQRYDQERQATLDFLKEYGDYEQQKLAITQEYEDKIAKASSVTERASLGLQKDKALKDLEKQQLEDSIDWAGVFNDLSGHTKEYLEGLRDQLQHILSTGNLPIDQMETIQGKIREINTAINEQGGMFSFANEQQREHTRRVQEAADAQERLNKALSDQSILEKEVADLELSLRDSLRSIDPSLAGIDFDEGWLDALGLDKQSDLYKKLSEQAVKLAKAEGNLANAREKTSKAWGGWKKAEDGVNEELKDAIARVAGNIKDWVNEYLGDLPDLLNEIGLGSAGEKVSHGLSGINNAANAAADFASGNYVGAALNAIKSVKDFGRAFGIGGGNAAEINKQLEKLSDRNEILTTAIDRLTDTMNGKSGQSAIKTYETLAKQQKELEKNLQKQLQLQMQYNAAHHSFNKNWKGFSSSELSTFNSLFGTNWNGDLNTLTADLAANLLGMADMMQKIADTGDYGDRVVERIKELAAQAGKAEEQVSALNEALTTTTKENVFDDFLSSLYDLADGSEDVMDNIAKNWQQMVNRMVINNLIGERMQSQLENWYEQLAQVNKDRTEGKIDDSYYKQRLEQLQQQYNSYVQQGQSQIEQFRQMGIIKSIEETTEEALDYLDTIRSAFEQLVSDSETDMEAWGNNLRNSILQNLIQSKLLDEEFDKWANGWAERYSKLMSDLTDGVISQTDYDRQLAELNAEFDKTTGEISEKSKQMWEAFGIDAEEAAEETKSAFEDLHSSFLSTLTDINGDVEAWSKNITKTMVEQLVERNILNEAFDQQMDTWRESFEKALEANDTEGLIALRKELEDLRESLATQAQEYMTALGYVQEVVSDTTFKDMGGDFRSQLMNLDATAEDWAESVGRKMAEKIVDEMVSSTMIQPFLNELQKAFNAAMSVEGATVSSVLTALTPQIEAAKQAFEQAQPVVHDILAQLGITEKQELPFSDLRSTFVSTLMDMEADAETFGKEIGRTLIEQMIDTQLKNQFQDKLDELNNEWAKALQNGDSAAIENIRQQMVQMREDAARAVQPLLDDLKELEYVAEDTPLSGLRSSFLSDLMDMESSTEDFADNINKILTEAFVDKFVLGDGFDKMLNEWQERYRQIMDSDISEIDRAAQLLDLKRVIGDARDNYTEQARAIQELMGITDTSALADQEAHVNMADKATYDQFELYLGIATAQQIALEQGNDVRKQILSTLQMMGGITSPNGDTVKEIRSMLRTTNEHLYAIKTATEGIRAEFMPRLQSIDNKLSKL